MATTISPMPAPQPQASMSAVSRIIGVFFNPKSTFADVARKPGWVAPLLLLSVVWLSLNVVMARRADWAQVSKDQIEKNKFASAQIEKLNEDQRDRAYQQAAERSKITRYVRGVIGWPLLLLVSGAIYFGAYKLIGGARINFAAAFAIASFAHLPMGLRELLGIPVVLLRDPSAIDPENFLASNLAALLPPTAPIWQLALLGPIDLFGLWTLLLMAIGYSAADPKKLPFGKSMGIAFAVWGFFVAFFTGLAWIFT
jgi:hypothetical protein